MKRTNFVFTVFALLFIFTFARPSTEPVKIKIIADKANVYLQPSENSLVIATVEKGKVLNIFGTGTEKGEWYYVFFTLEERRAKIGGFVRSSMAEIIRPQVEKKEITQKEIEEKENEKMTEEERKEVVKAGEKTVKEIKEETKKTEEISKAVKSEERKAQIAIEKAPISSKKDGIKVGLGLIGGYAMPSKSKYSEGVIYGGNIYLLISKNLAIEISGLSFQNDVEEDPEALSAGKLSVIPISLSLQGRLPVNDFLTPYIEVGGSYFLNDFSLNNSIVSSWNNVGFDINEEVEKSIGLQVGMGLDLFISKSFIFNIDCKYFINNTNGSWELIDQVSNEKISGDLDGLDMSYIYIGFGLKYLFSL